MLRGGRKRHRHPCAANRRHAGYYVGIYASHLTAKEIVAKNVKARGGLEAWRKVKTMVSIGHLETGNPSAPRVPFVLQQARPNKTRFEVHVHEKTSVRVFNGVEGWKLRPSRGGGSEPVAYTAEEIEAARDGPGIDGPLIDYQAKGIGVDFDGIDEVAGKKAYRLIVKLPSGAIRRWWIDAASFLDVRYERESHTRDGSSGYGDRELRQLQERRRSANPALDHDRPGEWQGNGGDDD